MYLFNEKNKNIIFKITDFKEDIIHNVSYFFFIVAKIEIMVFFDSCHLCLIQEPRTHDKGF